MALQTREQHIKREKATSNICTAQVLLAIMAGMYAVYHGAEGLKEIALRINALAKQLYSKLIRKNIEFINSTFFDTISFKLTKNDLIDLKKKAIEAKINFRYIDDETISINIGETTTVEDINSILILFDSKVNGTENSNYHSIKSIPEELERKSDYLTHEVFKKYHSETEMMRYIKSLERKDLSLTTSMIPLGSCTMKLNAASELFALTTSGFSKLHPFVPLNQAEGYLELFEKLEYEIGQITGLPGVSLQPNLLEYLSSQIREHKVNILDY